jgi:sulfoxide reductase heme-binding subunit YedZ
MTQLATATGGHLFWIASRAAGIAALLLSSAAVCVGLLQGGRRLRGRGPDLRVVHESLSIATIAAIVVHALVLLGDGFLKPSLADLTIPFFSSYQRVPMAIGIISGWALIGLGLSYYARARIGPARWKRIHRFTALAWLAGVVHSIAEGSDAGQAWFLFATAIAVLPALWLLALRLLTPPPPKRAVTA